MTGTSAGTPPLHSRMSPALAGGDPWRDGRTSYPPLMRPCGFRFGPAARLRAPDGRPNPESQGAGPEQYRPRPPALDALPAGVAASPAGVTASPDGVAASGPWSSRTRKAASSRIGTPSSTALSYLEPAFSPATTKLVFLDTEEVTLPPACRTASAASSRLSSASVPV